jgi:hypothetical protein
MSSQYCQICIRSIGVIIDSQLNLCDQIASVIRKAHQRANLIHRCFLSREKDSPTLAYKVYVRPILEHCATVWSPPLKKDILSIESVQSRLLSEGSLRRHSRKKYTIINSRLWELWDRYLSGAIYRHSAWSDQQVGCNYQTGWPSRPILTFSYLVWLNVGLIMDAHTSELRWTIILF